MNDGKGNEVKNEHIEHIWGLWNKQHIMKKPTMSWKNTARLVVGLSLPLIRLWKNGGYPKPQSFAWRHSSQRMTSVAGQPRRILAKGWDHRPKNLRKTSMSKLSSQNVMESPDYGHPHTSPHPPNFTAMPWTFDDHPRGWKLIKLNFGQPAPWVNPRQTWR